MWWQKRISSIGDSIRFADPVLVENDFIPLAYANTSGERRVDIVGTTSQRNSVVVLAEESGNGYKVAETIESPISVDYIIPADMKNTGKIDYVVIEKGEEKYKAVCIDENGKIYPLGMSDTMPFLFSVNNNLPALFMQINNNSFAAVVDSYSMSAVLKPLENFGALRRNHSSGFVDVNGNGIADLVLDTESAGSRVIEIWENTIEGYILKESIEIDAEYGPLIFGDFEGAGRIDIMFLSNEDGPTINLLPNKRLPFCTKNIQRMCLNPKDIMKYKDSGYSESTIKKYSLKEDFPNGRFSLYTDKGPFFPAVLDLNRDTYPDIVALIIEDKEEKIVILSRNGKDSFSAHINKTESIDTSKTASISFVSKEGGISNLLIEKVDKNKIHSVFFSENLSNVKGHYLCLSSVSEHANGKYSSPIVGATYMCRIVESQRVVIGFYPPQSGYAPMQSPIVTLGLGNTNVFVKSVHTRVPSAQYKVGIVTDKIVPNSELLMQVEKGKINSTLHLNIGTYYPIAGPIILMLLILFGATSLYFNLKEKRRARKRSAKGRYMINFDAL